MNLICLPNHSLTRTISHLPTCTPAHLHTCPPAYPNRIAPLREDYDSGPIILGMGAAATGLALNGSKSVGDYLTYYQVVDIVKVFESLGAVASILGDPTYKQLAGDFKAIAISFQAEANAFWF